MTPDALDWAIVEAVRFIATARKVTIRNCTQDRGRYIDSGPKETGALRRASMDLTRALAEMRK